MMTYSHHYLSSWWILRESNPRPSVRQTDALPAELNIHGTTLVFLMLKHYNHIKIKIKVIFQQNCLFC